MSYLRRIRARARGGGGPPPTREAAPDDLAAEERHAAAVVAREELLHAPPDVGPHHACAGGVPGVGVQEPRRPSPTPADPRACWCHSSSLIPPSSVFRLRRGMLDDLSVEECGRA